MANNGFEGQVGECVKALEISLTNCVKEPETTVGNALNSFWTQNVELPFAGAPDVINQRREVYEAAVAKMGLDKVKGELVKDYWPNRQPTQ